MLELIKDELEFKKYKKRFSYFLNESINFENNPFNESFISFLSFDFDLIYNKLFFDGLKIFLHNIDTSSFVFYTIEPDQVNYFYYHFNKYSTVLINNTNTDEDFNNILMEDPGNSPADALAINSSVISLFSSSDDWVILCSRDFEIGIIGFTNIKIMEIFLYSFETIKESFIPLKELIGRNKKVLSYTEKENRMLNTLLKSYPCWA
jgi:hypothetical protein